VLRVKGQRKYGHTAVKMMDQTRMDQQQCQVIQPSAEAKELVEATWCMATARQHSGYDITAAV